MEVPVLLLILIVGVYGAGTPAHVQSIYGQLVTSSSLLWVRSGTGVSIPENAVHSGTGKGVVCRGRHHGSDLVGVTGFGRCKVGFSNRLVSLNTFEVLTEVPGAVKLQWKPFKRFSAPPRGTVAGVDGEQPVYVARRLGETGTMLPAVVEIPVASYGTGLIKVYTDHTVEDVKDGDVLVEVEPVRYRLVLDAFVKEPKQTSQRKILASSSIFRFLEGKETVARMQKMLSYAYAASEYYSHVAGTVKGLPVKVTLHSGETSNRLWGMKDRTEQSESIMVGYDMKQNSAVDVSVVCEEVEEVQEYTGTLVAVFPDGSERERRVEGTRVQRRLQDIRPEYSKLYTIKDKVMGTHDKHTHGHNTNQVTDDVGAAGRQKGRSVDWSPQGQQGHLSLAVQSSASPLPAHLLLLLCAPGTLLAFKPWAAG